MSKILFICDPLASFNLETDTTLFLMLQAQVQGYEVYYCRNNELSASAQTVKCIAHQLEITISLDELKALNNQSKIQWYKELASTETEITNFEIVVVRPNPPFNMEYYYLTQILSIAEKLKVKVINPSYALRNFNEKLAILNFPHLITPTIVTQNKKLIYEFLMAHEECVIKPLDLMAGQGIFKLNAQDVNLSVIIETLTQNYTQTIMLQKFIPKVKEGDKRIFVVNGEVIEYGLLRTPQTNQIRSNTALGGISTVTLVNQGEFITAQEVGIWLKSQGIIFAGLDIIDNKINEINITSPTGIRQIFKHANINIAQKILANA